MIDDDFYRDHPEIAKMFQPHEAGYVDPEREQDEAQNLADLLPCPICGEAATDDESVPCGDCEGSEEADHYYGTVASVDDVFDTREEVEGR